MTELRSVEQWERRGSEVEGKVVLVTGAGAGIGRGIALVMAEQGAKVAVSDIDEESAKTTAAEVRAVGVDAIALRHDVSDVSSSYATVDAVVSRFGRLDILVNNAGVVTPDPFWEVKEADWERQTFINQKGLFFCSQAAVRQMMQQGGGVVGNISSQAGLVAEPLYSAYSATKHAAISVAQSIARELSDRDIRAFAVCPGVVWTPLQEKNVVELVAMRGISEEEAFQEWVGTTPLRRPQTIRDIGEMVSFLASARAANITGLAVSVTGGRVLH